MAVGDKIKASLAEDEPWQCNPVLRTQLQGLHIDFPPSVEGDPIQAPNWVKAQLGNRALEVTHNSYVGLFSSQQMVVQNRLSDPVLRRVLARNPVVQAKVAGGKINSAEFGEVTDDDIEELGLVLPVVAR